MLDPQQPRLRPNKRFDSLNRSEDLEEAINVFHQSLNPLVSGHPSTSVCPSIQGRIFSLAYSHTSQLKYLHKAVDSFRIAVTCETAPVSERFSAAKRWVQIPSTTQPWTLIVLRSSFFPVWLALRQQALISGSDGLAPAAAACAIRSGQYDTAVGLLEEDRAVFWS